MSSEPKERSYTPIVALRDFVVASRELDHVKLDTLETNPLRQILLEWGGKIRK